MTISDEKWAKCCEQWSNELRLVWSEVGIPHIKTGSDDQAPPEPNDPASKIPDDPKIGDPVIGSTGATPDDLERWQEVDDTLRKLFSNELLSGSLDTAEDFLDSLSKVAIGGKAQSNSLDRNEPQVVVDEEYVRNRIGKMRDGLDYWKGDARNNFKDYLRDMETALVQYQGCLSAAWVVVNKYKNMVEGLRRDVQKLVKAAQDTIDKEGDVQDQQRLTILSALVTTAVAVVGAAGSVATGGASAAATLAVGDALKNAATGAAVLQIGVDGKGDAVEKVAEGAKKIVADAERGAEKVKDALYSVTQSLTGDNLTGEQSTGSDDTPLALRPDRPAIITDDEFDPADFHHDDQPQDSMDGASRDELVEEPKRDKGPQRDYWIKDPSVERDFWKMPTPNPDAYEEQ